MMITLKKNYVRAIYGRFTLEKSHVLLGVDHRALGVSLFIHTTMVERQAHYKNDSGGTGRARPGILENVVR
jgi:hypothetical protein